MADHHHHRGILLIVILPLIEIKSFLLPLIETYGKVGGVTDALTIFCGASDLEQVGTITAIIGVPVLLGLFIKTIVQLARGMIDRCFPRETAPLKQHGTVISPDLGAVGWHVAECPFTQQCSARHRDGQDHPQLADHRE